MIQFVGSKTFWHAATSAQTCSLTDLLDETGATAALQQGDLVLVNLVQGSAMDRQQAELTPTGYSPAHADLHSDDDFDTNLQVSYKLMGGTPDASLSIPASDSTDSGVAVAIFAFRGVDSSSPVDIAATSAIGSNSGVVDPPAITPLSRGAWIVVCGGSASADAVDFTNPGGDLSAVTNHFRSVVAGAATRAASAVGMKIDWSSGQFDPSVWGARRRRRKARGPQSRWR